MKTPSQTTRAPMAVESMLQLGVDPQAITWVGTWNKSGPANYENVPKVADWGTSLGDFCCRRLGAFVTAVQADIAQLGWRGALQLWCSRLLPGLGTHMFHGMLRVAHAVRALSFLSPSQYGLRDGVKPSPC